MKILMVTPGRLPVPAVRGGAVENLVELILDYNEHHHMADITVVSSYDEKAAEKIKEYRNCEFYFFRKNAVFEMMMQKHILPYRFFDYCFSKKAGKYLKKKDAHYDRIVIQNELVNGWVINRYIKGNFIYHAHNDTLEKRRKKDIRFLESCDKVIAISDYLAGCFRQKAGIDQVMTIHNGIDVNLFDRKCHQENAVYLRNKYGIKQDETVVVFAGRLVPEKGIEILLNAFRMIPEKYKVVLLVIGASFFQYSGENRFIKHLKVLSAPVKDRIIFSGYVDYQEMPDYYTMADIGCIPSLWEEPFGLSLVEQMAMELPVIASDAGAIPEIVDEFCGRLIARDSEMSRKTAEAIMDLIDNADKRKAMGMAGRKKVAEHFNQQLFCENWFRTIAGGSGDDTLV